MSTAKGGSVGAVPDVPAPLKRFLSSCKEQIEKLTGATGGPKDKALTRNEIQVGALPTLTSAHAAGNPPTQAEFNKLQDDVVALRNWIQQVLKGAS